MIDPPHEACCSHYSYVRRDCPVHGGVMDRWDKKEEAMREIAPLLDLDQFASGCWPTSVSFGGACAGEAPTTDIRITPAAPALPEDSTDSEGKTWRDREPLF
jgi:hypothetical protein